ncbi:hypothetical protein CU254_17220 [Amycolatopsis sp. AA4]|uniref:hypothetical protein n=1 Tax=Actinomycetes TaxID=1760 RepID=UPI0001B53FFE|nr:MULTISPECIES: hypothetical protein [Actinomycetes]ATY12010.1 hypothetical protein CU254_17220 [Amycolatopsis sp. AA4]EFL07710.1 predicted protein [Streptomyces sp. AA4]
MNTVLRLATAVCLAASGYLHAQLYVGGYRVIPVIGPSFLIQASAAFAVAVLVALGGPFLLRLAAAALAAGSLAGFVLSRTTGLFGFSERGFEPAPEALLSVLAEAAVLLLVAVTVYRVRRATRTARGGYRHFLS